MAPKVDVLQAFIKSAAVTGIGIVWVNFTLKSFKMAWHIMFSSQTWPHVMKKRVMCEKCQ